MTPPRAGADSHTWRGRRARCPSSKCKDRRHLSDGCWALRGADGCQTAVRHSGDSCLQDCAAALPVGDRQSRRGAPLCYVYSYTAQPQAGQTSVIQLCNLMQSQNKQVTPCTLTQHAAPTADLKTAQRRQSGQSGHCKLAARCRRRRGGRPPQEPRAQYSSEVSARSTAKIPACGGGRHA